MVKTTSKKKLRELYQDIGLTGKLAFKRRLNDEGISYLDSDIDEIFLDPEFQVNEPARKNFTRRAIYVHEPDEQWEADLINMNQYTKWNKGIKYFLLVIDVMTKFMWVRALKDAKAITVTEAFKDILKKSRRKPKRVRTDMGSEFKKDSLAFFKQEGIEHFWSYNSTKAAIAERAIRTLKQKISRHQDLNGTYEYLSQLDKIVESYNQTVHSTIKMSPIQASKPKNRELVIANFLASIKKRERGEQKFFVGDKVRLSLQKNSFSKEGDGNYTVETFRITEVLETEPITYKVEDLKGESVLGSFYSAELKKTK
eukprot:Lithocolla_globosa_v1_NODE_244_length_4892_cov_475.455654.p1 type:complete len:312 gc:universal NODE_244_length_4892_cov_475.455654:3636-4571(+)